jgi:hypothetical protein
LIRKFLFNKEYKVLIAGVLSPLYKEVALRAYRIDAQSITPQSVEALKELSNVVIKELTTVVVELKSNEKYCLTLILQKNIINGFYT